MGHCPTVSCHSIVIDDGTASTNVRFSLTGCFTPLPWLRISTTLMKAKRHLQICAIVVCYQKITLGVTMNNIYSLFEKTKRENLRIAQKLSVAFYAPTKAQSQIALFIFGVALIAGGLSLEAMAQEVQSELVGTYNDERVAEAVNRMFGYIEGSFGALIMVAAGLGAIMSAAFGQYRAALGLLVVAVGSFILRSLVGTFFNTETIG